MTIFGRTLFRKEADERVWRHTRHPRFDPKSMRVLLSKEEIEALPSKCVTKEELREVICHDDYNPTCYYEKLVCLLEGEEGQDLNHRYLVRWDV